MKHKVKKMFIVAIAAFFLSTVALFNSHNFRASPFAGDHAVISPGHFRGRDNICEPLYRLNDTITIVRERTWAKPEPGNIVFLPDPKFQCIRVSSQDAQGLKASTRLEEDIVFLVTTPVKRLKQLLDNIDVWTTNHTFRPKFIITLPLEDVDSLRIAENLLAYAEMEEIAELVISDVNRYEERYFASLLSSAVANAITDDVKWFILMDDDTFWNVPNLLQVLNGKDGTDQLYIGEYSDERGHLDEHGKFGFGGAGVVLSAPLVRNLREVGWDCYSRWRHEFGGDKMLFRCIQDLGVPLTREPALHQLDFEGDISGLLESGRLVDFISIHHIAWFELGSGTGKNNLASVERIFFQAGSLLGDLFLRRIAWLDTKLNRTRLLTLGYSIVDFTRIESEAVLNCAERTWHPRDQVAEGCSRPAEVTKRALYLNSISTREGMVILNYTGHGNSQTVVVRD